MVGFTSECRHSNTVKTLCKMIMISYCDSKFQKYPFLGITKLNSSPKQPHLIRHGEPLWLVFSVIIFPLFFLDSNSFHFLCVSSNNLSVNSRPCHIPVKLLLLLSLCTMITLLSLCYLVIDHTPHFIMMRNSMELLE